MHHRLDLIGYRYKAVRESCKSIPPINSLYSITIAGHSSEMIDFCFLSYLFTLVIGSVPGQDDNKSAVLLSNQRTATHPDLFQQVNPLHLAQLFSFLSLLY